MAAPGEATAAEMPGASTNTGGSGGYEPDTTASRENVYLLCYSFNQDSSCFVCGTTAGFRVFCLDTYKDDSNTDGTAIRERLRRDPHPHPRSSVMRVAMLMRSSIFAMVNQTFETSGEPAPGCMNKVQIWEERKQKVVAELRCRNEVKSVALHKDIIVMVCEYVIYVYTSGDVKVILHLDTGSNKLGLCAVATGSDPWLLCCPAQNKGAIRIQCGQDATATHVFQAHQSGVACLELSASGSLVATASETGTVMKVFRTKDGEALYRLRRSTRPAVISSLAFGGPDDCYLAVASSSVTVHIFKLDNAMAADVEEKENASPALEPQPDPKWTGPLSAMQTLQSKAADALRGLTPQLLADLRSFGQFHLPDMDGGQPAVDTRSKQSNIAGPILAFHKTRTEPKIYILHYNGFLYEISFEPNFDPKATQECSFLSATTWFATRPDFQVPKPITEFKTEPGVRAVRVRTRQMNGKFYSKPLGSVT